MLTVGPFHDQVCRRIDNSPDGTSILQRIFEGVGVYYNYTGTVDCFDLDDDPHGMSGWNWQVLNFSQYDSFAFVKLHTS